MIQSERGVGFTVWQAAPVMKEKLTEACPLDALQELFRDYLVSINVGSIKQRDASGVVAKRNHKLGAECRMLGVRCRVSVAGCYRFGYQKLPCYAVIGFTGT